MEAHKEYNNEEKVVALIEVKVYATVWVCP